MFCAPGDAQHPQWMLTFEDASRGISVYQDRREALSAFVHASVNWNCFLWEVVQQHERIASRYTYAQLVARVGVLMQETEADPDDTPVPDKSWAACLRYFANASNVARLLTLTTTPSGLIHARLTQGQEIVDLYF